MIDDLYLADEYQGRRIRHKVMEEIEVMPCRNNFKRLQFQSEESNPKAKAFYTKIGYRPAARVFMYVIYRRRKWKKQIGNRK